MMFSLSFVGGPNLGGVQIRWDTGFRLTGFTKKFN